MRYEIVYHSICVVKVPEIVHLKRERGVCGGITRGRSMWQGRPVQLAGAKEKDQYLNISPKL